MDKDQNAIIISKTLLLLCKTVLFPGSEPFFLASFPVFMMKILIKNVQDNYFMSQQDK